MWEGLNTAVIDAFGEEVRYGTKAFRAVVTQEYQEQLVAGVPTMQKVIAMHVKSDEWDALRIADNAEVRIGRRYFTVLHAEPDRGDMTRVELRGK